MAQKFKRRVETELVTLKQPVSDVFGRGLNGETQKPALPFHVVPYLFGFRAGSDIHNLNQLADDLETQATPGKRPRGKRRD
jgi:hypothetical protein